MKSKRPPQQPKCLHDNTDEVRSANGATLYGWRCRACAKQFQRSVCSCCGVVVEHVANVTRREWTCRPCRKDPTRKPAAPAA